MSIAIEYLYKYIKKFDVNLLAGESGLNNKVRWTHIVENEEIAGFIQAEELLFTTGVSIGHNFAQYNKYCKGPQCEWDCGKYG